MTYDLPGVQHDFETATDRHADRRSHDRERCGFHAVHGILEILQESIQAVHVVAAEELAHCLQVDTTGKVLCVVVHDKAAHAIRFDMA